MSERLTKKCYHDSVHEYCCDEYDKHIIKTDDINGEYYFIGEAIDKLGQIEDFMEEQKIGFVEDLFDEFKSNKIDKAVYRKRANKLEQETQAIKSRWEKLKEYIIYLKNFSKGEKKREGKCLFDGENIADDILDRIVKLEKESEDETV